MERVVLNVDGGARGNPGPAAIAAVATTPEGAIVDERKAYIGETTNNVAEYKAFLLGLELARELGATEIEVVGDSELIIKQITGEYRVKHVGLRPLYLEAMQALRSFGQWKVRVVRREANDHADALVNQVLDEAQRAGT